jgi:nitroreductase
LPGEVWKGEHGRDYLGVDVAIVMDHLILAATDLGLGTCWIGAFDADAAREILDLPKGAEPLIFTPLGYPADTPKPKERKTLGELVRYL